jgi:hypothetical protein
LAKANNDPSNAPSPLLHSQKQDLDERIANVDLAKMTKKMEQEFTDIAMKNARFKSEEEKNIAKEELRRQAVQILMTYILFGKQDATYWLGLAAYDRANYASSEDYLTKRILEKFPNTHWRHGSLYNLAQAVEAAGQIDRAEMIYQSDTEAPDAYGRQLRARWLQEKASQ